MSSLPASTSQSRPVNGRFSRVHKWPVLGVARGDVPQETLRDTRGPGVETVAEMLSLAAEPRDSHAVRNVAMLRVIFDLALRVSEVVRLDVADLELDRGALWVAGKGRGETDVLSLPEATQAAITAWLRVRGTASGPLFLTLGPRRNRRRSRRRFTSRGIYRIVSELGEQAAPRCGRMDSDTPRSPVQLRLLRNTASRWMRSGSSPATRTSTRCSSTGTGSVTSRASWRRWWLTPWTRHDSRQVLSGSSWPMVPP